MVSAVVFGTLGLALRDLGFRVRRFRVEAFRV